MSLLRERSRRSYHKFLDYCPAVELAGNVQRTEAGRILYVNGGLIGGQQKIEAWQLVGELHRSVVCCRAVVCTRCKQVIHLTALLIHNKNTTSHR